MKKLIIFPLILSLAILSSCSKQAIDDGPRTDDPVSESMSTSYEADSQDYDQGKKGVAAFTIDNEKQKVDENEYLLVSNNSENAVSYLWDFGNGKTSTKENPSYAYKMHGNYIISLTVTDKFGNTDIHSKELIVLCVFGGGDHDQ